MNAKQQAALEALIGRALTDAEIAAITPHLQHRNDVEIAKILSHGRVRLVSRSITERGVRNCGIGVVPTSRFLRMLRELKEGTPEWLAPLLTGIGVPLDQHEDYADTLASAHDWLSQEAGIDIGTTTARQMLDLLSLAPGGHGPIVAVIKALAEEPDPVHYPVVSDALNLAEERDTL